MKQTTVQPMVSAARAEAERMKTAIATLKPGGSVRMSRDQFVALAQLIESLSERDVGQDGDRLDAPIDGIRWWIPLAEHRRALAQLEEARLSRRSRDLDGFTFTAS